MYLAPKTIHFWLPNFNGEVMKNNISDARRVTNRLCVFTWPSASIGQGGVVKMIIDY